MKTAGPHVLALLSVGIGGGSLILFVYVLLFGTPSPIAIVLLAVAGFAWGVRSLRGFDMFRQWQSRSAA